jgi:hypothetical protein
LADHVTDDGEQARLESLVLPRWIADAQSCLVAISIDQLDGRRIIDRRF